MTKQNATIVGIVIVFFAGLLFFYTYSTKPAAAPAPIVTEEATPTPTETVSSESPLPSSSITPSGTPSPEEKTGTVTVALNQKGTVVGVSITPKEILEDSRCPVNVQCIWAGTVRVSAAVTNIISGTRNETFTLGKPSIGTKETITLTEVTPNKVAGENTTSAQYRFVFKIEKK